MSDPLANHEHTLVVPDRIEPIIGYKAMKLAWSYGKPVLISPDFKQPWPAKKEVEAFCENRDHSKPCRCGLNAYSSLEKIAQGGWAFNPIWAEVKLWGKVEEHEYGYRAQKGVVGEKIYIDYNLIDEDAAMALRDLYGVRVYNQLSAPIASGHIPLVRNTVFEILLHFSVVALLLSGIVCLFKAISIFFS